MGIVDEMAIAAAERVERGGGARAGLFAWRKLAETASASETRGRAIAAAERSGEKAVGRSARVRRAVWLSREPETLPEGVEEAKRVEVREALPAEQIAIATVLLRSPSRFARAAALGICDELVAK